MKGGKNGGAGDTDELVSRVKVALTKVLIAQSRDKDTSLHVGVCCTLPISHATATVDFIETRIYANLLQPH